MNISELKNIIEECELENDKICVKGEMHEVVEFLKNNYSYDILKSITAVDLGDKVELIYRMYSTIDEEDVVISIKVQNEAESVADLFDSASADENEIFDMFGIRFIGNDDLKRLYMPENWEGYPLRKDYIQDDTRLAWNDNSDNA
jgi:NADH:ubiquinone oxidoreductase subunit C